VVQAAQSRLRNNSTPSCRTNSATRRLLAQSEVGAIVVEIANVIAQESLQRPLVHSDDMVEHIAAAASDSALGNPVLPRAVDGSLHALHVQGSDGSRHFQPVLLVVIKEQESGSGLTRESLT